MITARCQGGRSSANSADQVSRSGHRGAWCVPGHLCASTYTHRSICVCVCAYIRRRRIDTRDYRSTTPSGKDGLERRNGRRGYNNNNNVYVERTEVYSAVSRKNEQRVGGNLSLMVKQRRMDGQPSLDTAVIFRSVMRGKYLIFSFSRV